MYLHNIQADRLPSDKDPFHEWGDDGQIGFKFKKMFKRLVHVTPRSFQPKKILGAIASLTATVATGGLGPMIAPKIFSANSKTMQSLGYGMAAVAVVAGAVVLGPALAASMGPMLSSAAGMVGKVVTGMTGFMGAFNKLAPEKQQELSQSLTAEQIAAIENGQLDINSLGTRTATPSGTAYEPTGSDWSGSRYTPGQGTDVPQGGRPLAQADMFGGISPMMLMVGGATLLGVFLFQKKGR